MLKYSYESREISSSNISSKCEIKESLIRCLTSLICKWRRDVIVFLKKGGGFRIGCLEKNKGGMDVLLECSLLAY